MQIKTVRTPLASIGLLALLGLGSAGAQSLTVLPVNIQMAPNQMATSLTLINQGDAETSVQVRVLSWTQAAGEEELKPSNDVLVSPPIATIAPGATQIVRLVLGKKPLGSESTYRILVDQIPPAAAPGTVRIALRLSIPVFAAPSTRAVPRVKYYVETKDGQSALVAVNGGGRHETMREVTLTNSGGDGLTTAANASPYILAGATRRWAIDNSARQPVLGETLRLKGRGDAGAVDQSILVVAAP